MEQTNSNITQNTLLVPRAALLSVYDKTELIDLAKSVLDLGYSILASGGTYSALHTHFNTLPNFDSARIISIEDYTGSPEMLGGRVKTLHPKIHTGILAQRNRPEDIQDLQDNDIFAIDLVAVNLYPFQSTIETQGAIVEKAIEQIDIGGVTLLRAAAKNHAHVITLSSPEDYAHGVELLGHAYNASYTDATKEPRQPKVQSNTTQELSRQYLAAKTFALTAHYEATIAQYLLQQTHQEKLKQDSTQNTGQNKVVPSPYLTLPYSLEEQLRYGENPHQEASLFRQTWPPAHSNSMLAAEQLHGKKLSFNNIRDAEAAISIVKTFVQSEGFNSVLAVGVKHGNPCGVAMASKVEAAWQQCLKSDAKSIFGGIVALSEKVTEETASMLSTIFLEIIIAPAFSNKAMAILTKKKNVRLLKLSFTKNKQNKDSQLEQQYISVSGGLLRQDLDTMMLSASELTMPTTKQASKAQLDNLLFAWKVCKHVKSNAIVIARNNNTIGIGAGQMNRVGAAEIALTQAVQSPLLDDEALPTLKDNTSPILKGAVLASDAFLPMADTVALAAKYGIEAIIQPGGSIKDQDSIDECNVHGIAMVFTGMRHFLH